MTAAVYVVERFPERSQTFIQGELRALHRLDIRPDVAALYPAADLDTDAGDLDYTLIPSAARHPSTFLVALLRVARRHPRGLLRAIGLAMSPPRRLTLHALSKAVFLVDSLSGRRPPRFHGHFARASASTAMYAAAITGARFSFTAHALDIFWRPLDMPRKLARADVTVTVCEYNRRFIASHWPGLGHVVIVPCGVTPSVFTRREPFRPSPVRIVAVGRLVEKKGFVDLVDACARLRDRGVDFSCRIVGDGPERAILEGRIASHQLDEFVELTGSVPVETVRNELEQASLFCLPCVVAADGDRDSQPVVIKEAMAMELPVVATDEVGVPEVVDHRVGRLVPPHDPVKLADALEEIAGLPPDELRAMGIAGRARIEADFDLQQLTAELAGILALARTT